MAIGAHSGASSGKSVMSDLTRQEIGPITRCARLSRFNAQSGQTPWDKIRRASSTTDETASKHGPHDSALRAFLRA